VIHELKTHPAYFKLLADGSKTFGIRANDRGYQAGDVLLLQEYDLSKDHDRCGKPDCREQRYTGAQIRRKVGFIAAGDLFGLSLGGHVVMSLLPYGDEYEEEAR
jgi:hypothetical protein